ncbi:helix-turn-helix domain-containing protein [Roseateles sp.]|uniref:helix-turn-helix domain-containing protein n=1 Tax=Roseateles sp. TaxID=1971397 RepID=UPI003BA81CB0
MDQRLETRAAHGRKLKSLYRYLGFTASTLASYLRVSERTVYRWQRCGDVPFAVIRLLRVMSYQELPGKTWEGWHFSRGMLWAPTPCTASTPRDRLPTGQVCCCGRCCGYRRAMGGRWHFACRSRRGNMH